MSCPTSQSSPFVYYVGDTTTMNLKVLFQNTLTPLDLTSCTEIVINLPNADGSQTQLKLSLSQVTITSPSVLGQFSTVLNATLYPSPNVGELQDIFVTFTISGAPQTVLYPQALSVFEIN